MKFVPAGRALLGQIGPVGEQTELGIGLGFRGVGSAGAGKKEGGDEAKRSESFVIHFHVGGGYLSLILFCIACAMGIAWQIQTLREE